MKYFNLTYDGIISTIIASRIIFLTFSFLLIPEFSLANQEQENLDADREFITEEQSEEEISDTDSKNSNFADSDRPIEEIRVTGGRTLYSIRMEIVDEENKIFSMFNELNSDDKFDIFCDNIAPTGSHIKQRVCEPRFVTETRAQMTQDYMRGIGVLVESSALMAETALEREELEKEHLRVAAEYPEYLELLAELTNLRATLELRKNAQWSKWRELFGH